ncbi:hypothetical protein [Mycoplasma hafezii]|uniref:hypothetical protein n=1 Tax=Mycoplasma hafezii TaxID=525886 RepID=UPI003CF6581E
MKFKTWLILGSAAAPILPIMAVSCGNHESETEGQKDLRLAVLAARNSLKSHQSMWDAKYVQQLSTEITNAKALLQNKRASEQELKDAASNLKTLFEQTIPAEIQKDAEANNKKLHEELQNGVQSNYDSQKEQFAHEKFLTQVWAPVFTANNGDVLFSSAELAKIYQAAHESAIDLFAHSKLTAYYNYKQRKVIFSTVSTWKTTTDKKGKERPAKIATVYGEELPKLKDFKKVQLGAPTLKPGHYTEGNPNSQLEVSFNLLTNKLVIKYSLVYRKANNDYSVVLNNGQPFESVFDLSAYANASTETPAEQPSTGTETPAEPAPFADALTKGAFITPQLKERVAKLLAEGKTFEKVYFNPKYGSIIFKFKDNPSNPYSEPIANELIKGQYRLGVPGQTVGSKKMETDLVSSYNKDANEITIKFDAYKLSSSNKITQVFTNNGEPFTLTVKLGEETSSKPAEEVKPSDDKSTENSQPNVETKPSGEENKQPADGTQAGSQAQPTGDQAQPKVEGENSKPNGDAKVEKTENKEEAKESETTPQPTTEENQEQPAPSETPVSN